MLNAPKYDIWFLDLSKQSNWDGGAGVCVGEEHSLEEAKQKVIQYQHGGNAAWATDKSTGEMVHFEGMP